MSIEMVQLQGHMAANWKKQIKDLLSEFSDDVAVGLSAGKFDEILSKTFDSPHAYFCVALDDMKRQVAGMYIGTYTPIILRARLHIDFVVVSAAYRRQGVFTTILFPHMRQLANNLGCSSIDLTASKPGAQAAYRGVGFISKTTAFRLKL